MRQSKQMTKRLGRVMFAAVVLCAYVACAQGIEPLSLKATSGVHVEQHDGKVHKSAAHYEALCRVVLREFGVKLDTVALNLVFIGEDLRDNLSRNNHLRFQTKDWTGAYVPPSLIIMVGEEESDDTFMHEFMHHLNDRGLLFVNIPASRVHAAIEKSEGLLLGSRSYLQYLASAKIDHNSLDFRSPSK
jgi:hypothetical protein